MGKRIISLQEAQSVTNNDYLVIDNQSGGTKKVSAGFINDIVSDVEVDGTSVVNNGVAEIDLSGKQDALVAGSNISIAADGKTISATDTTYTAGTNVQINNGVISATDTTYTAGTGIDITGGVISSAITPGSTVTVTPSLVSGTKVADYSIDGTSGALYAPTPTVDDVEVDGASVVSSGVATINTMTGATSQANGTKGLVPAPTTTDTDKYLKGDGTWGTPSGGGGASAISDLTDVNLTNLSNGQILKYDSTNQKWVNANESGGGGDVELEETPLYTTPITVAGTYTLADDIENYDFVSFVSGVSNEGDIRALIVSDILNMLDDNLVVNCAGTNGRWFNITALSGDQLSVTLETNPQTMIHSVMGYKIKGGSGGGNANIVELSKTEYNALTPAQKTNGTVYFVGEATATSQLIPRVSETDSAITSSGKTRYSGGDNWHAFDGVESASGIANCWAADEDNTSAYIQYHFSQPYYLTQIQLKLYSHYSGDWTGTLNILGSNDGSNWTNISSTGQAVSVTAPLNEINTETINLNSNNAWDYIRVQANGTAFNIAYQPTCDFAEIYVYGASVPIVVEDYDIYFMGNKYTNNMDVTDLDFLDLKISQVSDITTMLNSGTNDSDSGTFISGTHRYEKVSVICGFKPDYVRVDFSLPGGATYAIYDSSVSTTTSHWIIPGEGNDYTIILGSDTGESGISDITDNGFKFRVNAGNTFEKTCTYTARVGGTTLVQTFDFSTLTQTQIDDLKSVLGLT